MAWIAPVVSTVVGGIMQDSASGQASDAQARSDALRLEEEQRVREQLRRDTEAQRAVADAAFEDYEKGLIEFKVMIEKEFSKNN